MIYQDYSTEELIRELHELRQDRDVLDELYKRALNRGTPAERELSDAWQKSVKTGKRIFQLFCNMSHEVRTPLNGLTGMAAVSLSKGNLTHQQIQVFHDIEENGNAMFKTLNDIFEVMPLFSPSDHVFISDVNIVRELELVHERLTGAAEAMGIELIINKAEVLPEASVKTDP